MARANPEPLTPRAYHARRRAARVAERERLRQRWLLAAREAIRRLAPAEPGIRAAYLFGSLVRPESCFTERSDIDVAVDCADPEAESRFWRALEQELEHDVDVRPLEAAVRWAVESYGECVYARDVSGP
ncbi:MAG: nucleotidyltransferase domain-containing protein [bacterium]|nr:nucleotidyltransferase domain-containing protein [bacterium]